MNYYLQKIVLTVVCLIVSTASFALMDITTEYDGIYYKIDNATRSAKLTYKTKYEASYSGDIVIPESIPYGGLSFSVTSIGEYAFYGCKLTSIKMPSTLIEIEKSAFDRCSLTSVTIPNAVKVIGEGAFGYCYKLTSVNLSNSVTTIGNSAFIQCQELASITIPESVVTIGDHAFSQCDKLTYINIPNSVKYLGSWAFTYCKSLALVAVGNSVESIHGETFGECTNLTSVILGNSVREIEGAAFSYCTSLTSINIPASVSNIGRLAFSNCNNLTAIHVDSNNKNYCSIDGVLFNKNITALVKYPSAKSGSSYVIPNTVSDINYYAFEYCKSLNSITLPNSVTNIDEGAFSGCSNLSTINIPNSVSNIGAYAFYGCSNLPSEGNLRYVGSCLVEAIDKSITDCKIKEGTKFIGNSAFWLCSNLKSVSIPNSVIRIGDSAFSGCSSIDAITIPNSVESIGSYAFSGCSKLKTINLPNSIKELGNNIFQSCGNLPVENNLRFADTYLVEAVDKTASNYKIKLGTKYIGDASFADCMHLSSLDIPNSATTIGSYVFSGCSNLASISIPNSVTRIGQYAFSYCPSLESINIPNSIACIDAGTFQWCHALKSINIPGSVEKIDANAFSGCDNLSIVTISNGVTYIGGFAFQDCLSLKEVHSKAVTPPSITEELFHTFDNVDLHDCKLYVPLGTKRLYETAIGWRNFDNIIEELTIIDEIEKRCAAPTISYEDGRLLFNCVTPNATFTYTISDADITSSFTNSNNGEIQLEAAYKIVAYANAEGYNTSDSSVATLYWLSGSMDEAQDVKAIEVYKRPILATSNDGVITITGLNEQEIVTFYSLKGQYLGKAIATTGEVRYNVLSINDNVIIAKIGDGSVKVLVK